MTTITLTHVQQTALYLKPAIDASASDESKSTFITLGKRTRKISQEDDFSSSVGYPMTNKRAKGCALYDETRP